MDASRRGSFKLLATLARRSSWVIVASLCTALAFAITVFSQRRGHQELSHVLRDAWQAERGEEQRDFVQNPVATKRVLRSIMKASDICATDPERVARFLVDMRSKLAIPSAWKC